MTTTAREDQEQEARAIAKFTPKFVLEGGAIHTYSPVKGKKNREGDEVEDAMIGITIRVPVREMVRYMGLITRLWNTETPVALGLMYVEPAEQRKHGLAEQASQNGSGPQSGGLEPIANGEPPHLRVLRETEGGTTKPKKRETAKTSERR